MSNAITKSNDIRGLIASDTFKSQVAMSLPTHMQPDRFARVALTALTRIPKLQDCTRESLLRCLMDCSSLGLEPDGRHAHLIPYGKDCTLVIDYKGLMALARRSGDVAVWRAELVKEHDAFSWENGKVEHNINWREDRGKTQCVYSYVRFKDGAEDWEVMTLAEVEAIRERSRAGRSGPWVTDFDEMAKKGLALDTPIPTPDGWTVMGSLTVGSKVFDMDGKITRVMAISEIKHLPCYRLTFSNGDTITCDHEHIWLAEIGSSAAAKVKRNGWTPHLISHLYKMHKKGIAISIPLTQPLVTEEADLPIPPWILGYWLGNGSSAAAGLTCHADDLDEIIGKIKDSKYSIGTVRPDGRSKAVHIGITDGLRVDLMALGLIGNKHIPAIYFRASVGQRLELLQGLMDSDGHISKSRGGAVFGSTLKILVDGVCELASSLGECVNRHERMATGYGKTVQFFGMQWRPANFTPVTLKRKLKHYRPRTLKAYRSIKSIEQVDSVPTMCIAVESESRTYLAGTTMIPTHNTVIRRHSKRLTLSPEFMDALEKDGDKIEERNVTPRNVSASAPALFAPTPDPDPASDPAPRVFDVAAFCEKTGIPEKHVKEWMAHNEVTPETITPEQVKEMEGDLS